MAVKKNPGGRPRIFDTPEDLINRLEDYFKTCDKKGKPYTKPGMRLHLGVSRQVLRSYREREDFKEILQDAEDRMHAQTIEGMLDGTLKTAGAIYILDNCFGGYKARKEIDKEVGSDAADILKAITGHYQTINTLMSEDVADRTESDIND